MKAIFLLCCAVLFCQTLVSQELLVISTAEELGAYLVEHQKFGQHKYESFSFGGGIFRTIDSVFASEIIFGDFDQDGDEDLFAVGSATIRDIKRKSVYSEMFFLLAEKGQYKKVEVPASYALWYSQQMTCFPLKKEINGRDVVEMQFSRYDYLQRKHLKETDTLSMKDGRPSLFSLHPEKLEIEQISFETTYCYGSCPVYRLEISKKRKVAYKGIAHVPKSGTHNYTLDRGDWRYLDELLQHIKPSQLKTQYAVNWTDSQTAMLTIKLADGRSYHVRDYGKRGTFGLTLLYDFFGRLVDELH